MSEEKETQDQETKEVVDQKEDETVVIGIDTITDTSSGEVMNVAELAKSLAKQEKGMEVTSVYYEFPMGEEIKCFYIGNLMIKGQDGKDVPAVRMLLSEGKMAITASAVVVSTFRNYRLMQAFSVKMTGQEQSKKGKYYTYQIFTLVG